MHYLAISKVLLYPPLPTSGTSENNKQKYSLMDDLDPSEVLSDVHGAFHKRATLSRDSVIHSPECYKAYVWNNHRA